MARRAGAWDFGRALLAGAHGGGGGGGGGGGAGCRAPLGAVGEQRGATPAP